MQQSSASRPSFKNENDYAKCAALVAANSALSAGSSSSGKIELVGQVGDAGAAVHAQLRANEQLGRSLESRLVTARMNGVARARVETEQVFHAGISNHICHLVSPMLMLVMVRPACCDWPLP